MLEKIAKTSAQMLTMLICIARKRGQHPLPVTTTEKVSVRFLLSFKLNLHVEVNISFECFSFQGFVPCCCHHVWLSPQSLKKLKYMCTHCISTMLPTFEYTIPPGETLGCRPLQLLCKGR